MRARVIFYTFAAYAALFLLRTSFDHVFDFDIHNDILFKTRFDRFPLDSIHAFSALLPLVCKWASPMVDAVYLLHFLGAAAFFVTLILLYQLLKLFLDSDAFCAVAALLAVTVQGFWITAARLDDNLFQLPIILGAFYAYWRIQAPRMRVIASGLLLGLGVAAHMQALIYTPVLALLALSEPKQPMRTRIRSACLAVFCAAVVSAPVIIFFLLNKKGTGVGSVFSISAYTPYFNNPEWSLFATERSWAEIGRRILSWLRTIAEFNAPVVKPFKLILYVSTVKLLGWVWLILGNAAALFALFGKHTTQRQRRFMAGNYALFIFSALFALVYDDYNTERWIAASLFLMMNYAVGAYFVPEVASSAGALLKSPIQRARRLVPFSPSPLGQLMLAVVGAFLLSASLTMLHQSYDAIRRNHHLLSYPNINTIFDVCSITPVNALLVTQSYNRPVLSVYRPGPTLYYVDYPGVESAVIERGVITPLQPQQLGSELLKHERFYVLGNMLPILKRENLIDFFEVKLYAQVNNGVLSKAFGMQPTFDIYEFKTVLAIRH